MPEEPRYRLSEEELDRLRPGLDIDALEQLLGRVPPEQRGLVLKYFSLGIHAGIIGSANPELDALVKKVWGPTGGA